MNWIFTGILMLSLTAAMLTGSGQALGAAVLEGAKAGIQLTVTLAGPLLLWSGVGKLMDKSGVTELLSRLFTPLVEALFPSSRQNPILKGNLCANFCANLLGLGNAATPRGILAVKGLKQGNTATDEVCRLVVLNTASIQLIPTSVAAIRSGLGCTAPFDILPAVWMTSFCSAGMGLLAAFLFGKLWHHA